MYANGDDLPIDCTSPYNGAAGTIFKIPDLAIIARDGCSYIAIEIECDLNRPLETYRTKLEAYEQDPTVAAVWYICETERTAKRVRAAAANYPGANVRILAVRDLGLGLREADMRYSTDPNTLTAEKKTALLKADIQRLIA